MKEKELLCACPAGSCWSGERSCFELEGGGREGIIESIQCLLLQLGFQNNIHKAHPFFCLKCSNFLKYVHF